MVELLLDCISGLGGTLVYGKKLHLVFVLLELTFTLNSHAMLLCEKL